MSRKRQIRTKAQIIESILMELEERQHQLAEAILVKVTL
jgi:hypothetical protein